MDFTHEQTSAIERVVSWATSPDGEQVFRLFGPAGVGKTTLAKEIANRVGAANVLFAAFTGKAAHVLSRKGCSGATTLHRLMYAPKDKSKARLVELQDKRKALLEATPVVESSLRYIEAAIAEETQNLRRPAFSLRLESPIRGAELLIVDEVSMVGQQMGEDLLTFGTKVLVLGDPFQLPPVKATGFFTDGNPDILLKEVHRQSALSPVLALATKVRNRERIDYGQYGSSSVVRTGSLSIDDMLKHDQIIVGRNATRIKINAMVRERLGRKFKYPEPGDKLICLRNDHEVGLLNGSQWEALGASEADGYIDLTVRSMDDPDLILDVPAHPEYFVGSEPPYYSVRDAQCFDYGWAITCHKAQGSQWENVAIRDESSAFSSDSDRWLYTAITRAANSITLIR